MLFGIVVKVDKVVIFVILMVNTEKFSQSGTESKVDFASRYTSCSI